MVYDGHSLIRMNILFEELKMGIVRNDWGVFNFYFRALDSIDRSTDFKDFFTLKTAKVPC